MPASGAITGQATQFGCCLGQSEPLEQIEERGHRHRRIFQPGLLRSYRIDHGNRGKIEQMADESVRVLRLDIVDRAPPPGNAGGCGSR